MAGLLDFMQTPEGQGLLAAVASGAAGARRGAPINTLGAAGLGGLLGYSKAQDNARDQGLYDLQTKQLNASLAEAVRKRQAQDAYKATLPEDQRGLFDIAPDKFVENSPQFQKPQLVEVADPKDPLRTQKIWLRPGQTSDQGTVAGTGQLPEILDPRVQAAKASIAAAGRAPHQPMQPVAYVDDKGNTIWGTITDARGRPAANFSPSVQGAVTGAKKDAELGAEARSDAKKAVKKSDQLLSVAKEAGDLLDLNPTGSGFGSAVDTAGRFFGQSSTSSQVASKLETLSGWLTANVPRMEGPQSNIDIQNYQTMAAKVGDRTVPVVERQAALRTLVDLQEKYKHLNQGTLDEAPQPAPAPARRSSDKPGATIKFDAQGNPV